MSAPPLVVDIKRNSLDDGPGIRSVVFFKGCSLDCEWCHNPECKSDSVELSVDPSLCVGAAACLLECPEGALALFGSVTIDRARCTRCLQCVDACPSGALSRVGDAHSVESLVARLLRDRAFFERSGGGVTLSGGEPTRHIEYLGAVAAALSKEGIHLVLQTCGTFGFSRFREWVYPHLDLVHFDLKLADSEEHRRHCGVPNEHIVENFRRLIALAAEGGVPVLPRVPLIPGITARRSNVEAIAALLRDVGAEEVALMAYNPLWPAKARRVGAVVGEALASERWMSGDDVEECASAFMSAGVRVV